MRKRLSAFLFCLCLLLSIASPVCAEEEISPEPIRYAILNKADFLAFAESCRLDSFSQNLEVVLKTDINLTGTDFAGIPIFCGTFRGNGYTIRGLNLTQSGSNLGLFRYLTETAVVQDLNVSGTVQPGGSKSTVGGIAGSNAGTIQNCSFTGTISGGECVGGIAGLNAISGLVENCTVNGQVFGTHFVGGLAGENKGILRSCENYASINGNAQQNTISLSDITISSITDSESAGTVTDIGGIAGKSTGVIRSCANFADVGYQQMGYNVGGIAGTQGGSVLDCENHGQIHGRKDVGGIVGHMEPTALIRFEEDALQILQKQLDGLSGTVTATAANVQSTGDQMATQVGTLIGQVADAQTAVESLIPDEENPEFPDEDAVQAAQNAISGSISDMTMTLRGMQETTYSSIGALSNNLHSMQNQLNAMRNTLGNVTDTLGGSIKDVSDLDTEEDLTGKVSGCINYGSILADWNAGGIAGSVGMENDLDMEEDWSILGDNSLNFESELRAVLLNCVNQATITCKKENAGGIVGDQAMGLVKECMNVGDLDASGTEYAGGIAGKSLGYIRSSYAKGRITAGQYVGGIAGEGRVVTDCYSVSEISDASEYQGAILGKIQEELDIDEDPISGNYYFSPGQDLGGIDGISYAGQAQALNRDAFLALEGLPDSFRRVHVHFLYPNGNELCLEVPLGEAFSMSRVPTLPSKAGSETSWKGLNEEDLETVLFDVTYEVDYAEKKTVLQTGSEGEAPKLLLQGLFTEDAVLQMEACQEAIALEEGETLLEAWNFTVSGAEEVTGMRLRLSGGVEAKAVKLLLLGQDGLWRQELGTADGSYLTVPINKDISAVAIVRMPSYKELILLVAAGLAVVVLAGSWFNRKEKRTK